jgi:hypothetical protein
LPPSSASRIFGHPVYGEWQQVPDRRFPQRDCVLRVGVGRIYFFVIAPMNAITERRRRGEAPPDPDEKCPECLSKCDCGPPVRFCATARRDSRRAMTVA